MKSVKSSLNNEPNVGKDTRMEIEDSLGASFRFLKLSTVHIFIDKYEGNEHTGFHSFKIYDNSVVVGVDLIRNIAQSSMTLVCLNIQA